uniref:uncharacterized protein n=1 Tax=Semicossyphus pulcher TaxID=241346 RepID=UPI0037E7DF8B
MKSFAFNSQSTDGSFKELTNPASAVNVPSTEHHGAAAETKTLLLAVRVGGEVTLLCENETKDHENCTSTRWLFSRSERTGAQVMFESGTIYGDPGASSGRLSVTENCSLVIQKVTDEDAGRYTCGQNKSGEHSGVDLSVVSMTEQKYADNVTLRCSVSTYEPFSPRVKWLYDSKEVDRQDTTESQSTSTASVTFEKLNNMYISRYNSVQCEVTVNNKVQLFPFRLPSGHNNDNNESPTSNN